MLTRGGGFGIFTDGDQQSTFWGFEFRKSVFIWVLVTAAVFFWLLNKSCISKYFIFLIVFFGSRFIHSPCTSVNTVEFLISYDYYHIVLNVCQMNRVLREYISRFYFSESFFGGVLNSVRGKVFLGVIRKYPIPLIPVRRYGKSTPGTLLYIFWLKQIPATNSL